MFQKSVIESGVFICYRYSVMSKNIVHDFRAFLEISSCNVKISEDTFCRVEEVQIVSSFFINIEN